MGEEMGPLFTDLGKQALSLPVHHLPLPCLEHSFAWRIMAGKLGYCYHSVLRKRPHV